MEAELTKRVAIAVTTDLLARSRIEDAAERAGWRLDVTTAEGLAEMLAATRPDLLILDLDAGGASLLDQVGGLAEPPVRVVGFFSHVDTELRDAAETAGCDAMPRGRFWRSLPDLLAD